MLKRTTIHGSDSQALRDYVIERLNDALGAHESHVVSVVVTLEDVNGANKGGADRRTNVVVHLKEIGDIVVEEFSEDPYSSVHTAGERLKKAVARKFEKLTDRHHHHAPTT